MKVYTQTWYRGNNYGSVLQAYALQKTILSLGYDCSVLNYRPTKADMWKLKIINHSLKATIDYKINEFLMKKNGMNQKQAVDNLTLFDAFRREYMRISEPCSTAEEINELCGHDAVFVCGSDQIWNPYFYDPFYFLEFIQDSSRKIAYAPSFGVENLPNNNKKRIQKAVTSFTHISVREKRGAEIIRDLTGTGVDVTVDPTMLLSLEQWSEIAAPINEKKDYLFCYFLSEEPLYMNAAREIAKEKGLVIRMLPMVAADFRRDDTISCPVGPCEWISWVKNAGYVLTDSFHCTLFAIRFHKQFNVLQRFSDGDKHGQNSRIHSLLRLASMEDRLVVPGKKGDYSPISESQFEVADSYMEKEIGSSKSWLENALNDVKSGESKK